MFSPIARRLFLIFITTFSVIQLYAYSHPVVLGATSSENFDITAAKIANQVTVRILTKFGSGSGVVIKHEGQTYTVLTNNHVVTDSPEDGYGILTSDGNIYPAKQVNGVNTKKLDLALVKFTSPEDYQVVTLPKSKAISEGEKVYASGFPAWHFIFKGKKITKMEETRNWGVKGNY